MVFFRSREGREANARKERMEEKMDRSCPLFHLGGWHSHRCFTRDISCWEVEEGTGVSELFVLISSSLEFPRFLLLSRSLKKSRNYQATDSHRYRLAIHPILMNQKSFSQAIWPLSHLVPLQDC